MAVPRLLENWHAVRDFLESGGDILLAILVVTFLMWTLILERYWYLSFSYRGVAKRVIDQWHGRHDRSSWFAHQVRRGTISRISQELTGTIPLIKTLVALCPLLGLLGTVTGMVEVFDVMALEGTGNPRAMASGVSHATIPTMAGMTAALSGLIFSVQLDRWARAEAERLADQLSPED
jgi:biopolymer transport protein ExbB